MQSDLDEYASSLDDAPNNFTEEEASVYLEEGDVPKLNKKKITADSKAKGDIVDPETKVKLKSIVALWEKQTKTNKAIKSAKLDLESKTIEAIQNLSDAEVEEFLHLKWILPVCNGVNGTLHTLLVELNVSIVNLTTKYAQSYNEIERDILSTQEELSAIIGNLTGDKYAVKGLIDFANRLK